MTGISESVQIGVVSALSASAELAALLADREKAPGFPAIYDDVTQPSDTGRDEFFPYIVVGSDSILDFSTDSSSGAEAGVTIHVWSRYDGKKETKQIQGAIYNALHRQEIELPGHGFIGCDFESEQPVVRDPDGHTYHGVSEFKIYLDEEGYGL